MKPRLSLHRLILSLAALAFVASPGRMLAEEYVHLDPSFLNKLVIIHCVAPGKMMTAKSTGWKTNVGAVYNRLPGVKDAFIIKHVRTTAGGNKVYNIVHQQSNRRIGFPSSTNADNASVVLTEHDTWANNVYRHQFYIKTIKGSGKAMIIQNVGSWKVLDLSDNGNGFDVRQWGYVWKNNQRWSPSLGK